MPTRRYERIALARFLVGGLAAVFVACVLIKHVQAQFVNPPPPLPPPVFNPSSPNTVPQPRYTPLSPTTPISPTTPSTVPGSEVTSPVNERLPRTAARSHQGTSVAKTRSVHRHRGRSTLVTYSCSYLGCVRTEPWAFPCQYYSRYCYPYGYYQPYGWYRY
jgi:hypothetical protein